jgi:hypothetical protein
LLLGDEQPLGRRAVDRLDPQPIAGGHEAERARLQREPQFLDRVVERDIAGRLGHVQKDVVEDADGVDGGGEAE